MVKYKCNGCGKTFKGDYSTKTCPNCKSENISEVASLFANKTNKILLGSIVGIAVVTIVVLCLLLKPSSIEAVLTDDDTSVIVTVTGVSNEDLKDLYQVQVYTEEGESKEVLFFDGEHNFVSYGKNCLLPGRSYSFVLEKIGGGNIPNLSYNNKEYKCAELSDGELDFGPEIVEITPGEPNVKTGKYDNIVINVKTPGDYIFSIGNIEQKNNTFNNVPAGDYTVTASDAQGRVSEKQISLPEIPRGEIKSLTVAEVQSVFDDVLKGNISAGDAEKMLARGSVQLQSPIYEDTKTLAQLLNNMTMYGNEYAVVVVDFKCDELGKIKSGTLKLRLK